MRVGKTGTATDFLLLEIGWLSQRFAVWKHAENQETRGLSPVFVGRMMVA